MRAAIATTAANTAVLLRRTPTYDAPGTPGIVWERNFELRADGRLAIGLPVSDGSDLAGIGIFALDEAATRDVMDDGHGVRSGVFTYEVHPARSFPGDALP